MMHAFSSTLAGGAPSSLPPALSVPGVKLALCRPGRRAESLTVVKAQKKPITEADLYMGVDTIPQPEPAPQGTPWYISVPVGFVAVIAVLRTIKALTRRRDSSLEERGFKRGGTASEDTYTKALRGVRTVQYEELPDEVIMAARRRRRQEVAQEEGTFDLDSIELPENHPFAVKNKLSEEEEELQRLRLSARRGLSAEDMRLLKQQQALADQLEAEAEEMERKNAQRNNA